MQALDCRKCLSHYRGMKTSHTVTQDVASWRAGYQAGHSGQSMATPPPGADPLAYASGVIEGQADRHSGKVRLLAVKLSP